MTSSFTQINDNLIQAGRTFGGSPWYVFRRITLPMIVPGILTGWMMIFIIAFRELVTASLIAPPNVLVVSTYINRNLSRAACRWAWRWRCFAWAITTTTLLILNAVTSRKKAILMRVTFAGGVGEHGRNCFLVEGETLSFLVDCGRMAGAQDPYPALTAAQARGWTLRF